MMKNVLFFSLIISLFYSASAQVKISELPTYSGNPAGAYVPIVLLNTNRKIDASFFGYGKVDSITIGQGPALDSIFEWRNGVKSVPKITRAGSTGGGGTETDPTFNTQFAGKTTSNLSEGTNQYFTNVRARSAHSAGFGQTYNPATGVHSTDTNALKPIFTDILSGEFFTRVNGSIYPKVETYNGDSKVVADANYTITLFDENIILPNPAATRTLTLPAASTMPKQTVTIYCAADVTGEWVLSGSYVQLGTTGALNENFINSGIATGDRLRLTSVNDNGTWKWFDLK